MAPNRQIHRSSKNSIWWDINEASECLILVRAVCLSLVLGFLVSLFPGTQKRQETTGNLEFFWLICRYGPALRSLKIFVIDYSAVTTPVVTASPTTAARMITTPHSLACKVLRVVANDPFSRNENNNKTSLTTATLYLALGACPRIVLQDTSMFFFWSCSFSFYNLTIILIPAWVTNNRCRWNSIRALT